MILNTRLSGGFRAFIVEYKLIFFWIVINLAICLPLAATLNLWLDEYYSLSTSSGDFGYVIHQSAFFELQPPLYFILLSLWTKLNNSIFFARCLSIIFIASTIYISGLIAKRYLIGTTQYWFPAFVALNPFIIYAAIEGRPPALGIFLSALMILFFFDGYLAHQTTSKAQKLYIIVSVLAIYTQYYLTLLLAAHCITLIVLKYWTALRRYAIGIGIITLCFLPIIILLPSQLSAHSQVFVGTNIEENFQNFSVIEALNLGFERFTSFIIPLNSLLENKNLWKIIRLCFLSLLIFGFLRYRHRFSDSEIAIWLTALVLILLTVPLYLLVGPMQMQDRHLTVLFLPALMVICLLFKFLFIDWGQPKLQLVLGLIPLALIYSFSLYTNYKLMAKPGDWKRVAAYVEKIEGDNSPIIVFNGNLAPLLQYYYQGSNSVFPFANEPYFTKLSAIRRLSAEEISSNLQKKRNNASRIILVNYNYYFYKFNKKEQINALNYKGSVSRKLNLSDSNLVALETVVKEYFTIENQKDFLSTRVRILRPKRLR